MLKMVTLTGADDTIDPRELVSLSHQYPFVEWGILIGSRHRDRFPSPAWFEALDSCRGLVSWSMHLSLHICGGVLERILNDAYLQVPYQVPLRYFQRAQLNFHGEDVPAQCLGAIKKVFASSHMTPIVQLDGVNNCILDYLQCDDPCRLEAHGLYDQSHGAGVLPSEWPTTNRTKVGFAGGLGPENVVEEIKKIESFHTAPYWIDMETKLRTMVSGTDIFDLDKCRTVLDLCRPLIHDEYDTII